ncbi:hypothetical protein BN7_2441 [Wickerhamomyces ciferrii]|uniref:RING-CH-type domain-containing protein n=1 Tax=Wickerhamomyces ciferrii (strain ATCC 14091 / BCRC 22168 / CBS 111 / JCM 3599 / NBRC 0793 / NRRL Y-1031 F-60-10) TaxID=1206466 RepID=K0KCS8_WICCF|nr:uncharacterized protein BN7_2441 [Wickerhamomyces ciferrii]CCH42895.1 hypothetical protein BN7_2441 [Wickerhamomyces ciferrii]
MDQERCYICLGTSQDSPPLSTSRDSKKLIRVCPCSLRAHKRCLIDWISDFEFNKLRDSDDLTNMVNQGNNQGGYRFGVPLGNIGSSRYQVIQNQIKCPQCSTPLILFMKPSKILSLHGLIKAGLSDFSKTGTLAILGSAGVFTVSVTALGILVSLGLKMFSWLAPDSVLTKLLGFKNKSIDKAFKNEEVGGRQLGLIGGFPVFLWGLRSSNLYMDIFATLYPTLLFKNPEEIQNLNWKNPKLYLLLSQPLKRLYNLGFSLTFNKIYYNWTRFIKPIFLADRISLEELNEIEEENSELNELKDLKFLKNQNSSNPATQNLNFIQKLYNKIFGSSPKERSIIQKKRIRDLKSILTRDYSQVFQKQKSISLKILTTIIWPLISSKISLILLQTSPSYNEFINNFSGGTPDDATYLSNLLISLSLVLIKDFYNLFIAYKEVKFLSGLGVVEHEEEAEEDEEEEDEEEESEEESEGEEEESEEEQEPRQQRNITIHDIPFELMETNSDFQFNFDAEDEMINTVFNFDGNLANHPEMEDEVELFRKSFRLKQCESETNRRLIQYDINHPNNKLSSLFTTEELIIVKKFIVARIFVLEQREFFENHDLEHEMDYEVSQRHIPESTRTSPVQRGDLNLPE